MKLDHVQMPTVEELKTESGLIRWFPEMARLGLFDRTLEEAWFKRLYEVETKTSRHHFDCSNQIFRAGILRYVLSGLGIFAGTILLFTCLFWILDIKIEDTATLMRIGITPAVFILFCCALALFGDARTFARESRRNTTIVRDFLIDWIRYCEFLEKTSPSFYYDGVKIVKRLSFLEEKRAKLQQRYNAKIGDTEADTQSEQEIKTELSKVRDELHSASELFLRFGFEEAALSNISLIVAKRREAAIGEAQNST